MRDFKKCSFEWESEIPSEWTETRLKDVLSKQNREILEDDQIVICSNQGKVTYRGEKNPGLFSMTESGYQGVNPGDLLIHGMDTWHGAIAVSGIRGKCTGVVHVCESHQSKSFIAYYLQSLAFRSVYKAFSNGVRQNTSDFRSWQKAGAIPIALPPLKEQISITNYLDKKCAEIDKAIDAAKASIEEYKLYKKSVILQTVTKGLNHNVPMKDSGIEHLDSIPAHWAVRPVKSLMSFSKGINILKTDLCDEGEPCVTYGEAHGRLAFSFDADRDYIRRAPLRFTVGGEKSIVYTGDFIFAATSEDIAGSGDFTFNTGKKPVFAGYHSVVARNIFPDQFDSLFLAFLFDSLPFRYQIQKRVGGVKVYSINARNIGSALAWIPPIEEQIEISRYLEQVRSNLDIAIQTKSQIIEELKAYKKSLIWETVTGKRQVPCL